MPQTKRGQEILPASFCLFERSWLYLNFRNLWINDDVSQRFPPIS